MADKAIGIGARIGVVATLPTTLDPTVELLNARAAATGKAIEVVSTLCEGAFQAVAAGDTETHDRLVTAGIRELMAKIDVVVLAQASMARAANAIPEAERTVPILSSPQLAVNATREVMRQLA